MLRLGCNSMFYTPIARLLLYRVILYSHNTLPPRDINETDSVKPIFYY